MGDLTQPQSQYLLTHSQRQEAAAAAAAIADQIERPRPPQTTANLDDYRNPPSPSKIPLRPCKFRKVASDDAPGNGEALQIVDDNCNKPLRAHKDNGKNKKRNASQALRVSPRFLKPLSSEGEIDVALRHLRASDPLLIPLIDAYPPPTFDSYRPPFLALTKSIVFQQLACKAASAIYERFLSLCGGEDSVLPETVLSLSSNQLRDMGISSRKATYLYDLANKYRNGILSDASIVEMDDKSLFTMLTMVKGIGSWSVHMFMIFSLHRPDVLPVNDLGIRKGVQFLYGLEELPRPSQMEQLCERWRPYRSIGSWYMWRFVETKGTQTNAAQLALVGSMAQQEQQEEQQHQHQLQLLDPINSIANFG